MQYQAYATGAIVEEKYTCQKCENNIAPLPHCRVDPTIGKGNRLRDRTGAPWHTEDCVSVFFTYVCKSFT